MRKLLLASFKHSNGVETFEGYRLVAIESTPNEHFEKDQRDAILIFKDWFAEWYPSPCELLGVQCFPTIDGTKPRDGKGYDFTDRPVKGSNEQFLDWFGRQASEYVQDWFSGRVTNKEVIDKFNS